MLRQASPDADSKPLGEGVDAMASKVPGTGWGGNRGFSTFGRTTFRPTTGAFRSCFGVALPNAEEAASPSD